LSTKFVAHLAFAFARGLAGPGDSRVEPAVRSLLTRSRN